MEENEIDRPTLEQLRRELRNHPDILKYVKNIKGLKRLGREKLMELLEKCGIDADQIDLSHDPFGLLDGIAPNRMHYEKDSGIHPFDLTIEMMGVKKHFTAFFNYDATIGLKKNDDDEFEKNSFRCEGRIDVLTYKSVSDMTSSSNSFSSRESKISEVEPEILKNPSITDLVPKEALMNFINRLIDDEILSENSQFTIF